MTLLSAVNAPVLLILAMLVPLYLMSKSVPLCEMVKLVVTRLVAFVAVPAVVADVADVAVVADPAVVAEVAVAALIFQLPDAPVPVGDGTSVPIARPSAVRAAEAEVAPVPPLVIGSVPVT